MKSYIVQLEKKLEEFIIKTQLQIQFIKSIMNSYNIKNNQFYNYEIYLNLKNLKLKGLNTIEKNELDNIKNEIKKIEEKRKKNIYRIKSYILKLEKKLKEFIIKTELQLQFIKSIMKSCNNKNNQFFNYEIYLNLKNLKLKELNSIEINDFLNKEYNIIDKYKININNNIEDKVIYDK